MGLGIESVSSHGERPLQVDHKTTTIIQEGPCLSYMWEADKCLMQKGHMTSQTISEGWE